MKQELILIRVNKGVVLVDKNIKLKECDSGNFISLDFDEPLIVKSVSLIDDDLIHCNFKITHASKELNLDVPELPDWKVFEIEMLGRKYATINKFGVYDNTIKMAFEKGYNHNKDKKWTDEDIRNAFRAGERYGEDTACNAEIDLNLNEDLFLKSLEKLPSKIIMENNQIIEVIY